MRPYGKLHVQSKFKQLHSEVSYSYVECIIIHSGKTCYNYREDNIRVQTEQLTTYDYEHS